MSTITTRDGTRIDAALVRFDRRQILAIPNFQQQHPAVRFQA